MNTKRIKDIVKPCLYMVFTTIILINWQACQNKDKGVFLSYKFEKDKNYLSNSKFFVKLNVNKILLPPKKDSSQVKNSIIPLKKDILFTDIRDMFANDNIREIELEITKDKSETVTNRWNNSGEINIKSVVNNLLLKANGVDFPLEQELASMLKVFLGGEQVRKRSSSGEWQNLPKIMGLDLTEAENNPQINKFLMYLKSGFSYPDEKIEIGYVWNNDLHIFMPVDSISDGQSQGFIRVDIENKRNLEKIEKNIANINFELSIKLSWDVVVPGQGYTKCNLIINGRGYQFFDLKKGWSYGMFFKGNIDLKIDAETIDEENKNNKIPIIIDATGTVELANKHRE